MSVMSSPILCPSGPAPRWPLRPFRPAMDRANFACHRHLMLVPNKQGGCAGMPRNAAEMCYLLWVRPVRVDGP